MDADPPTGKAVGAAARAASMSPAERSEVAKRAATKRWASPTLKATHGSADHPLKIGDIEIPCYVLEDGRRVLSMRGVLGGLGMSQGTAGRSGDRLLSFASGKGVSQFVSSDLLAQLTTPIKFTPITHSQSFSVCSQMRPPAPTPALLNTKFGAPKRAIVAAAKASTSSDLEMSKR